MVEVGVTRAEPPNPKMQCCLGKKHHINEETKRLSDANFSLMLLGRWSCAKRWKS